MYRMRILIHESAHIGCLGVSSPSGRRCSTVAARDSKSQPDVAEDWGVEFFQRHADDDDNEAIPGREFLDAIPETVSARIIAALDAVADAPPPAFSGGGYW